MTSLMDATVEGEQNNLKQNSSMNHWMGLKLTLAISKQEIPWCNHANLKAEHPLKINSRLVVSLTLPEKRKLGAEDKFWK
jgi:hypothetical protein